ncbi:MAG TPA: hypothetical protein VKY40_09765 [Halanaerobiales bacterium]|nr:hypothetical protein [Halanaerobiales bacterium]
MLKGFKFILAEAFKLFNKGRQKSIFFLITLILSQLFFIILFFASSRPFLLLLFPVLLMIINIKYINYYIQCYRAEIKLVEKLNCKPSFVRYPLLLITFIPNIMALFMTYITVKVFYSFYANCLSPVLFHSSPLGDIFDASILAFFLLLIIVVVILSDFYLFLKHGIG